MPSNSSAVIVVCLIAAYAASANAAPSNQQATKPESGELLFYGNHSDQAGFVVKQEGVSTSHAIIEIVVNEQSRMAGCAGDASCIADFKADFTTPQHEYATANCETGEFKGFWENHSKFFVGETTQNFGGQVIHDFAFDYEGFRVPAAPMFNTYSHGRLFRRLCPTSFLGEPKTSPPGLNFGLDCQTLLNNAEELATQQGMLHVLNVKIIDASDVKINEAARDWSTTACTANVMLSDGTNRKLNFVLKPLHGEYFLDTLLQP